MAGKSAPRITAVAVGVLTATMALTGCGSGSGGGSGSGDGDAPKVALSNYYNGNNWRKTMEASFQEQAEQAKSDGRISDYTLTNSNGSVTDQASQIQSLVLEGYDMILIDAASPTGLNGAIQQACDAGVTVVVFDSLASADCATKVATDYVEYGELEAQYVVDQLGGQGNVLIVRGIAGNTVDADIYEGMTNVLSENTGMTIVGEVNGDFTQSVAQQAVAGILPSLPTVDAVLTMGNDGNGSLAAFQQADYSPLPLVIMGNTGQDLIAWADVETADPAYQTMSVSSYPSMSTVALWTAFALRDEQDVPDTVYVPVMTIPRENRDAWVAVLQPDDQANNILTEEDTAGFIEGSSGDDPTLVDAPQPIR